jgi:SAM-dependent methyltransferase
MNDFQAASLQSWSVVAPDWGELVANIDRQLGRAASWMIDAVDLQPGECVLELAGGPGTLSLMAGAAVGEQGQVICTDFAEPMVETARRRIAQEGAENIECRVADAQAIDLPESAVDVVLCRMGYMLMGDPAAALRESARVLRSGGRLALAVWSDAAANPWAAVPMQAIMSHLGAPPPPAGSPGLWALADGSRLCELLTEAGLGEIRTETLDDQLEYDSVEVWLETTARLAGPIRALFGNLDEAARAAISARVAQAAEPYAQPDGRLSMPERMLVATATKP